MAKSSASSSVANALRSATTVVSVSAATAPSSGQVLTATASTTATWQSPTSTSTGWISESNTGTYVSGSAANIGTFTLPYDASAIYKEGMPLGFTNTSAKYGWVVKDSTFAAGVTTVTIYTGTDYTIANANFTSILYGFPGQPGIGFPMSPAKWTAELSSTTDRNTVNPSGSTWYNAESLSIPIGTWNVSYTCLPYIDASSGRTLKIATTLSTANNSESDVDFSARIEGASLTNLGNKIFVEKVLTLTATTTYYLNYNILNTTTPSDGGLLSSLQGGKCFIRARISYLP